MKLVEKVFFFLPKKSAIFVQLPHPILQVLERSPGLVPTLGLSQALSMCSCSPSISLLTLMPLSPSLKAFLPTGP